jgi:hypothetical protein
MDLRYAFEKYIEMEEAKERYFNHIRLGDYLDQAERVRLREALQRAIQEYTKAELYSRCGLIKSSISSCES